MRRRYQKITLSSVALALKVFYVARTFCEYDSRVADRNDGHCKSRAGAYVYVRALLGAVI